MVRAKASAVRVEARKENNRILSGLPKREGALLFPELEFVSIPQRTILNDAGGDILSAYFVASGVASVLNVMSNGASIEVGLIGSEGFVGLPLVSGLRSSASQVVMQVEGSAFRIAARKFLPALQECPVLARRL